MELQPWNTSVGDLCTAALQECGRLGVGQVALSEDIQKAWSRLQWMLQQWERRRWLVYHLRTYSLVSTGQQSYTFGPGGEINTSVSSQYLIKSLQLASGGTGYQVGDVLTLTPGPPSGQVKTAAQITVNAVNGGVITGWALTTAGLYSPALAYSFTVSGGHGNNDAVFNSPIWTLSVANQAPTLTQNSNPTSARPAKLESAFLRQIQIPSPNQVDYFMDILQSHEDYDKIRLKNLSSFPGVVFLDSDWPLANLFFYPVPQASIYSINVTVREQLPIAFATLGAVLSLPYEYYACILYNLAEKLCLTFQLPPRADLNAQAKAALGILKGPNTQIARLRMPAHLVRPGIYNIFSDQDY